jgi:hypothetical protein
LSKRLYAADKENWRNTTTGLELQTAQSKQIDELKASLHELHIVLGNKNIEIRDLHESIPPDAKQSGRFLTRFLGC